jgi:hypothetical protein
LRHEGVLDLPISIVLPLCRHPWQIFAWLNHDKDQKWMILIIQG